MADFSFGGINVKSRKQVLNLKTYDSPVLADKTSSKAKYDIPLVFLVEEHYEGKELEYIQKFLGSLGCSKYIILDAISCDYDPKEAKDGLIKFYKSNKSKFFDYIPSNAPIIPSGAALYSLLQEDDLYQNAFEQIIFGKSSFWFSPDLTTKTCHKVYPIASFKNDIFGFEGYKKWCPSAVDSYKTKLTQIQINNAIRFNGTLAPRYPQLNKVFIHNTKEFNELFYEPNKTRKGDLMAWDTETSGLNFWTCDIGCITISFDGITGYFIPFDILDYDCKVKLDELFKNNRQCLANGKFDCKFMMKPRRTKRTLEDGTIVYEDYGFKNVRVDEDVIQLGHTLDEERSNSLKSLTFLYTEFGGYERPLDEYKEKLKGDVNYLDIPVDILWDYAVMDAIMTHRVFNALISHCRELDSKYPNEVCPGNTMEHYYRTYRIPAENCYTNMEYLGFYVNKDKLSETRRDLQNAIDNTRKELCEMFNVDEDFQWESTQQLGKLIESKGWEDLGRNKDGSYMVNDYSLSRWIKTHPEADKITKLKSYNTLMNTFVGDEEGTKGWTQYIVYHPEDNSYRMHPSFMSMMADSGRSKCNNPNVQQVPSHGEWSKEIKSVISTPDPNEYYLCTVDYSSLQARLCCVDVRYNDKCKDGSPGIVEAVREGGKGVDLHSITGHRVFYSNKEVDVEVITVEQDGKTYEFLGGESVLTSNRGEVFACELTEEDTLI